jgi:hypothetical protein
VVAVNASDVCVERVDDGPTMLDGCKADQVIADLPLSLQVGSCIEVVEYHPIFRYVGSHDCDQES